MLKRKIAYWIAFFKTFSFAKAQIREIIPKESVKRELPCNYKISDNDYFQHEGTRDICGCYEVRSKKAIVTKEGIVVCNSKVIRESLSGFNPDNNFVSKLYWNNNPRIIYKNENICCIFTAWSDNYYHWFAEVVPKLIYMQENKIIDNYIYYFPENHNKQYIVESLNLLKVKYAFFRKDEYLLAHNLYFISLTADLGNFRLHLHNAIRKYFSKIVCNNQVEIIPFRRIYISRKKASKRFVTNENDVISLLKKYKFEIYEYENLSLTEQIKLMNETQTLVTIHGAGLTNMHFMQKGAKVVEFRLLGDTHMNLFYSLANALSLGYYYLLCKGDDSVSTDIHEQNLNVSTKQMEEILTEIYAH